MAPPLPMLTALAPSIPGMDGLGGSIAAGLAIPVAGVIYVLLFWGQRSSAECSWKDDDQLGLKIIVGTLIMVGVALFAAGLQAFLHLMLTFKEFVPRLKGALPDLLVGAVVIGGAIMFAVPKTNHEEQPKALRLVAGAIALMAAVATVIGFDSLLKTVFNWPDWHRVAGELTSLLTAAVVFGGSGYLYAKMVGVEVPDLPMPDQAGAAQAQHAQQQYQQPPQQAQQQQYQQQQAQQQQYQQPQQAQQAAQQQQYQQPPQQAQQPQQPQQAGYQAPAAGAPARPGSPPRPGGGYPPPGGGGGGGGNPYGNR